MSTHTIGIVISHPGNEMVPVVADGTIAEIEAIARQAIRDSGLLPDDHEVLEPAN